MTEVYYEVRLWRATAQTLEDRKYPAEREDMLESQYKIFQITEEEIT